MAKTNYDKNTENLPYALMGWLSEQFFAGNERNEGKVGRMGDNGLF